MLSALNMQMLLWQTRRERALSENNAHFNFSLVCCHKTRQQQPRYSNRQQQWQQDCRICANKKFGKQSWRHKTVTATATSTATATAKATAMATNCGVRTQKLVASYLTVPHFLPQPDFQLEHESALNNRLN